MMPPPPRKLRSSLPPEREDRSIAQLIIGVLVGYLALLLVCGQTTLRGINQNERRYREGTKELERVKKLPTRANWEALFGSSHCVIYVSSFTADCESIYSVFTSTPTSRNDHHENSVRRPGEARART